MNRHRAGRSPARIAAGVIILLLLVLFRAGNYIDGSLPGLFAGLEPQATAIATAAPQAPTVRAATATPAPTALPDATTSVSTPGPAIPTPPPEEGLPAIRLDELPPEARDVIRLIAQGGPFPYRQDGTVFQNRERLLPRRPSGYYREYTVETPGSPDRGARRIVAGEEGELYYTADHYASFQRIVP